MKRKEILDKAAEMVTGHREGEYGSPENNFSRIGAMWSAYLGVTVTPVDVAMLMAILKIARVKGRTMTKDSFIDLAGYAACGGEIATGTADSPSPAPAKTEHDTEQVKREVMPWTVYRHFKGNLYRVLEVATHTETKEKLVIYRALYGEGKIYARPVSMFLSRVDKKKYPNATQAYRFEEVVV